MHYDVIILLTFHEAKDCLIDNIKNFKRYMPNALIVINNGLASWNEPLSELTNEKNVLVSTKSMTKQSWNMIPIHISMLNFLKEQKITSDYVLPLASNQLFIKDGFYSFMKKYEGGIHEQTLHDGLLVEALKKADSHNKFALRKYVDMIGKEHFKYHSNHDSMFFLYEDFVEMIEMFNDYEYDPNNSMNYPYPDMEEEYLYAAFLLRKKRNIAWFKEYSYWNHSKSYRDMEELELCLQKDFYIMKRIKREYDDPVRVRIRELGNY